jgi:hypothetical protein
MTEKKCKPVGISIDPDTEALLDKLQRYLNNTMFAAAPLNKSAVYRMCLQAGAAIMQSKAEHWEKE